MTLTEMASVMVSGVTYDDRGHHGNDGPRHGSGGVRENGDPHRRRSLWLARTHSSRDRDRSRDKRSSRNGATTSGNANGRDAANTAWRDDSGLARR